MIKNKLAPFLASVLAFFWILIFFQDVIQYPNAHLFNEQGDGIKAFYVYADHIKNDESYHQQRNMNYPYGQTYIFTDGQPAVANVVKFISGFIPFFETHSIAIYNYLILFSFAACAFFTGLILQRLKLPALFVIVGGFCIAAMSPHIWRISGHPTMSYALFFPLSWYLLLLAIDTRFKKRWVVICILNNTFWFFVHPYLGMVITFFYSAYFFFLLVSKNRNRYFSAAPLVYMLLMVCLPLFILKVYTESVDVHLFRSEYPWGFWIFYTTPRWVFLPDVGGFAELVSPLFSIDRDNEVLDLEKLYYVGLAVDAILLMFLFRMVRYARKTNFLQIFKFLQDDHLRISFGASIILLLFSMCIPFMWGLESLVDHASFLRQFRALGRFAWAFYSVSTVAAVYGFYLLFRYLRIKKLKLLSSTFFIIFFSMFLLEAWPVIHERAHWAGIPKNVFNEQLLTDEYKTLIEKVNKEKDKYQCIVTLPFFHVGSENFGVEFTIENIKTSCIVSYWCNMPLMASSAARSPILEAKNIMQFFSPGFIKKAIQDDLPNKKDFLLLYDKSSINDYEKSLIEKSEKIFDNGKFELWSLPYDQVFSDNSGEIWNKYTSTKDSLLHEGIFEVSKSGAVVAYNSFDSSRSDIVYKGSGALKSKKGNSITLFESANSLKQNVDYTLSFWYYNKGELINQVVCAVEECKQDLTDCKWVIVWDPRTSMVIDGDWTLVEKTFQIPDSTEKVKILLAGIIAPQQYIYVDEFLLRESSASVYSVKDPGKQPYLFYNNFWVKGDNK